MDSRTDSASSSAQLLSAYNELHEILKASPHTAPNSEIGRKNEIMKLLHDFNDIKDAAQTVVGTLANLDHKTIKEMHVMYNLPLNE